MSHYFRHVLVPLCLLLVASVVPVTAHAAKTMLATCTGAGADFLLTDVTPDDAAVVYDLPAAPGADAVLVVDKDSGKARWSTESRAVIDKECGGDGDDEIALFSPIQPQDGLWKIKMTDSSTQGCTGMLGSAAKAGVKRAMGREGTEQMEFRQPFHPQPLMKHAKDIHWAQTGLNTWRALMAQSGDSSAMRITVTLNAEVVSPTRIKETQWQDFELSGKLAGLMGGSGACRVTAIAELTRVDD